MSLDVLNSINITLILIIAFSALGFLLTTYRGYKKSLLKEFQRNTLLNALSFMFRLDKSQYSVYEKYRIWIFVERLKELNSA